MIQLIRRRIDGVDWQVLPGWERTLFGAGSLTTPGLFQLAAAEIVKSAPHRTVYRVPLAAGAVFLKHDRLSRTQALAALVRGSPAQCEFRAATGVLARGIPTARPIAWGQRSRGRWVRESYLVTEEISDGYPLGRYAAELLARQPSRERFRLRRRLIGRLARCVAAIHAAGIRHNDLHADNFVVRPHPARLAPDALPEIYLLDLPRVRLGDALDWAASFRSLVVLAAQWWDRTTWRERWRFWRTYRDLRPELDVPQPHRLAEQFDYERRAYSRRVSRRRDRRALRTNRDFQRLDRNGARAHAVRALSPETLAGLLEDPDGVLRQHRDRAIKTSRARTVVEAELPSTQGPIRAAYKRYRPRNAWKAICDWFRAGRAIRGWTMGHALLAREIATARPVAVVRPGGWLRRSQYLATEWIDGAENLHVWGWNLAERPPAERLRRAAQCAESLGRLVGRMHAWRIVHGDLKGANVLVVQRPDGLKAYLIDVEQGRICRRLRPARQQADLARLAVSIEAHPWVGRAVRCRFLRAYAAEFPAHSMDWKRLWPKVARRAGRLLRQKRRRGREVL